MPKRCRLRTCPDWLNYLFFIMILVVFEKLSKIEKTFILDGYPRCLSQIEVLHTAAGKPAGIIFLNLSEDASVTRLLKRAVEEERTGFLKLEFKKK